MNEGEKRHVENCRLLMKPIAPEAAEENVIEIEALGTATLRRD